MIKTYYMLTKPGIIFGNVVTTAAGFALASKGHFDIWLFALTMLGLALVIASAGVFNNFIDLEADAKMERTKDRPLVMGVISPQNALGFGTVLGIIGVAILYKYTNLLTVLVALSGFFVYLVLYAFWKYRSFYGTIVGSIAGAVPPVVGYTAVSNRLDLGALILFLILVLWQMPHFFAIAVYHLDDYRKASIPVLPVQKGLLTTKMQSAYYIVAFTVTCLMLTVLGYTGRIYFIAALALGASWLALSLYGFAAKNDKVWGRQMFAYSLAVIMALCLAISLDVT